MSLLSFQVLCLVAWLLRNSDSITALRTDYVVCDGLSRFAFASLSEQLRRAGEENVHLNVSAPAGASCHRLPKHSRALPTRASIDNSRLLTHTCNHWQPLRAQRPSAAAGTRGVAQEQLHQREAAAAELAAAKTAQTRELHTQLLAAREEVQVW